MTDTDETRNLKNVLAEQTKRIDASNETAKEALRVARDAGEAIHKVAVEMAGVQGVVKQLNKSTEDLTAAVRKGNHVRERLATIEAKQESLAADLEAAKITDTRARIAAIESNAAALRQSLIDAKSACVKRWRPVIWFCGTAMLGILGTVIKLIIDHVAK